MRRGIAIVVLVVACGTVGHAQVVVYDIAVTLRNSVTAAVEGFLEAVQRVQRTQLQRMSRRLSVLTNLTKYRVPSPPPWLAHSTGAAVFARDFYTALDRGNPAGEAYWTVVQPMLDASDAMRVLPAAARRVLLAQLATIDVADAATIAGANDAGRLRANGRSEVEAIAGLERDVTDGSDEQSTTAVLDKISGSALIADRQRQARAQLLGGVVEQLLIDSKRARDTESATMNMQLVTWRDQGAANAAFVAGSGDALRTWRQP